MSAVHVIHENPDWTTPLFRALAARDVPFVDWHLGAGTLDLATAPPHGVFYSRMSASAHTRGHRHAPEHTAAVLAQYQALEAAGVRVPRTVAAVGRDAVLAAAGSFDGPFLTKPNRGGKGLGVRLFRDVATLAAYLDGPDHEPPVDGITLVQRYIEAPTPTITRVEFVGGKLLYAVAVDTSGGFELCPADACAVDDAFCPAGAVSETFRILPDFDHPLVERYRRVLATHDVGVAAFEFVADASGRDYTYDLNTNTNYNARAEAAVGRSGMDALADYLGRELAREQGRARAAA